MKNIITKLLPLTLSLVITLCNIPDYVVLAKENPKSIKIAIVGDSISEFYNANDTTGYKMAFHAGTLHLNATNYPIYADKESNEKERVTSANQMWYSVMVDYANGAYKSRFPQNIQFEISVVDAIGGSLVTALKTTKNGKEIEYNDWECYYLHMSSAYCMASADSTATIYGSGINEDGIYKEDYGCSMYGSDSSRLDTIGSNGNPDVIIIEAGTNDIINDVKVTSTDKNEVTFKSSYKNMLDRIHNKYPDAKVICVAPANSLNNSAIYRTAMIEAINDVNKNGIFAIYYEQDYTYCYSYDGGTHPNATGQYLLGVHMVSALDIFY